MKARKAAGFTVIELMVTIMMVAILLGIGVPSLTGFMDTNRMASAANDLVSSIYAARAEAVKRRQTVSICPSSTWNAAVPACAGAFAPGVGWIVFFDPNGNVSVDAGDTVLIAHAPVSDRITMTVADNANPLAANEYLQFAGSGFLGTAAIGPPIQNILLCDGRGDADTGGGIAAGRWVQIAATGRPEIYRQRNEVQSAQNPAGGC